ncbi:HD-GYP domain-containing protein [Desulfobulbus alkaliphilus]|uniref:HD-GYP domain-containing protein n=1 Tax=Desulfobulbus alkaliphilus TaxID=869814 RepID=UPI001962CDB2|nr:HD domain-containing protein [Desulfobulbus alkaliphilus]MBM9537314.1 HD domain-containing protein [Desulfobulbus alkaliphilus]
MDNSKGSIILKAISPTADEEQLTAYLEKRAKGISPEKIPELLANLPVVLSRNVTARTGALVTARLAHLGAEALFVPAAGIAAATTEHPPSTESEDNSAQQHNSSDSPAGVLPSRIKLWMWRLRRSLPRISKEIWIILSMLAIAWLLNYTIASRYLLLGFYTLPAVMSAYLFGRRQAVLTAFASILLVSLVSHINPERFDQLNLAGLGGDNQWYHIISWGCILLLTAYTMGTLYEKNKKRIQELRQTYSCLLLILRRFIAVDELTEKHCLRVSIYAAKIASAMGLDRDLIEDIRSAALLHDLGKQKISRDILHKAASLKGMRTFSPSGPANDTGDNGLPTDPLHGPLGRILPMLTTTPDPTRSPTDPNHIGAGILAVADAYDTLTSGGAGRDPVAPSEAKEVIISGTGREFDPESVHAFTRAFARSDMELPDILG